MKKSIGIILMVLLFLSMATGLGFAIGNLVTIKSAEDGKSAYELSVEAGEFQGTVEEWLDWIKGKDGVAREVEIKFDNVSKKIMWKYVGEEDDKLKELVSLEEIAQEVETDLDASIKTLEEKVQGLEGVSGKVDALVEEIEAIKESLKTPGQTEIEKVKNEIKAAYEEAIAKAVKDLEDRLGKGDVTQEELNAVASQVTALQTELKSFKEKYDATEEAVDALQKDLEAAKKDLTEAISKVDSGKADKADVTELQELIKDVNSKIEALQQINHDYVSADNKLRETLEKEIANAKDEAVNEAVKKLVETEIADLEDKIADLGAAIDEKADKADVTELQELIKDVNSKIEALQQINHDYVSADNKLREALEKAIADAVKAAKDEIQLAIEKAVNDLEDKIYDEIDNLKDLIESGKIEFYRNGNKIMYKFAGQNDSEGKVLIDLDADVVTGETVVFETRVTAEGTCIYWGYVGQDPAEYKLLANFNQARDKYTVKFVVDGQQYDVQTIVDGKKAQEPTAPTKPGYKFVGWYYGEYEWEFVGDSVTEDMVLVAKFSAFVVKEEVENKSVVYSFVTDKAEELENANTLEVQFTVKASEVVNVNYRLVNPSVDEFYVELVSEVSGDYVTYTLVVGHLSGVLSLTSNEVIALDFVLADGVEAANVTINYVEVVGSGSYLGQYTVGYNDKIEVK